MPAVVETAESVRRGERKARDVLEDCILRIEEGNEALNAFFVPRLPPYGSMMGTFAEPDSNEPGFYLGCWNDNIHNHQLNMR